MAEKTGRKRIYDGDERERHRQAVKNYVENQKIEAVKNGIPLRRQLQKNKVQLNVSIETYLHNKLKAEAERRNMTLRDLVIEKLSR